MAQKSVQVTAPTAEVSARLWAMVSVVMALVLVEMSMSANSKVLQTGVESDRL